MRARARSLSSIFRICWCGNCAGRHCIASFCVRHLMTAESWINSAGKRMKPMTTLLFNSPLPWRSPTVWGIGQCGTLYPLHRPLACRSAFHFIWISLFSFVDVSTLVSRTWFLAAAKRDNSADGHVSESLGAHVHRSSAENLGLVPVPCFLLKKCKKGLAFKHELNHCTQRPRRRPKNGG
jgi:hypothetical protein